MYLLFGVESGRFFSDHSGNPEESLQLPFQCLTINVFVICDPAFTEEGHFVSIYVRMRVSYMK